MNQLPTVIKPIPRRSREICRQAEPLALVEDFSSGLNPEASLIVLHPRHGERSLPFRLKMKKSNHFSFDEEIGTAMPTSFLSRTTEVQSIATLATDKANLENTPVSHFKTHSLEPKVTPLPLFPILPTATPPLLRHTFQGVLLSPARDCPEILLPIIR